VTARMFGRSVHKTSQAAKLHLPKAPPNRTQPQEGLQGL
jgi:hypothetical protein